MLADQRACTCESIPGKRCLIRVTQSRNNFLSCQNRFADRAFFSFRQSCFRAGRFHSRDRYRSVSLGGNNYRSLNLVLCFFIREILFAFFALPVSFHARLRAFCLHPGMRGQRMDMRRQHRNNHRFADLIFPFRIAEQFTAYNAFPVFFDTGTGIGRLRPIMLQQVMGGMIFTYKCNRFGIRSSTINNECLHRVLT